MSPIVYLLLEVRERNPRGKYKLSLWMEITRPVELKPEAETDQFIWHDLSHVYFQKPFSADDEIRVQELELEEGLDQNAGNRAMREQWKALGWDVEEIEELISLAQSKKGLKPGERFKIWAETETKTFHWEEL